MSRLKIFLSLIVLIYLLLCLALFAFQRNLLYFPTPEYEHPYTTTLFSSDNEQLKVLILNEGKETAILYFGGNAESVVHNAAQLAADFPNDTVYLVNYRGYGGSSGQPTEAGIYADTLYIYDAIKSKHHTISAIGRSLGSGVATYLAANRTIHKMILITPYDSIQNVAKSHYPFFPISLLIQDEFNSAKYAADLETNTLILIASHDTVVPRPNTMQLISAFSPTYLSAQTIPKTTHNTISDEIIFHELMHDFMN